MNKSLEEFMASPPFGKRGSWIRCSDRKPDKYSEYEIIRRRGARYCHDKYTYDGKHWVTHAFNISDRVEAWFDTEAT